MVTKPPAAYQPATDDSGLALPGLAHVLVLSLASNAHLHREIVRQGLLEFLLHSARTDRFGLGPREYRWVFDELVRTKPPEIVALPDGTILDALGHVVPATPEDLRLAKMMDIRTRTPRVFLSSSD